MEQQPLIQNLKIFESFIKAQMYDYDMTIFLPLLQLILGILECCDFTQNKIAYLQSCKCINSLYVVDQISTNEKFI